MSLYDIWQSILDIWNSSHIWQSIIRADLTPLFQGIGILIIIGFGFLALVIMYFASVELFKYLRHPVENYPRFREVVANCPWCWVIYAGVYLAAIGAGVGSFFDAPHGDRSLALAGGLFAPLTAGLVYVLVAAAYALWGGLASLYRGEWSTSEKIGLGMVAVAPLAIYLVYLYNTNF